MLPGYPQIGDLVRFNPPLLAYSADSAQAQVAGQTGVIHSVECDSWAFVWFGSQLVIVNTAYLSTDDVAETVALRGRRTSKNFRFVRF